MIILNIKSELTEHETVNLNPLLIARTGEAAEIWKGNTAEVPGVSSDQFEIKEAGALSLNQMHTLTYIAHLEDS